MSTQMNANFKAVVFGCRCCGNQRRYIVTEDEAGYIEAQFADQGPVILFNAYDLTALDVPDNGRFSQTLPTADLNGLQIFGLSGPEIAVLRSSAERAARVGGSVRPVTAAKLGAGMGTGQGQGPTPKIGLSSMLGGVRK